MTTREPISYAEWKVDDDQRRREDRLDRMVAAVYPLIFTEVDLTFARPIAGENIGFAVSLAWGLLEAVDAQIARAAQPETTEIPCPLT